MAYPRNPNTTSQFPQADTKEMHALMECMSICRACARKCVEEGNKRTAMLCHDCSDICDLTIKLKSCDSEYCQQVSDLCAHACRHCASECGNMQAQHCQECAEACRRCADSCSAVHSHR